MEKKKNLREISTGIIISVVTCFMLFLFAPLELYFSNQGDFWFDLYMLLPVVLGVFATTTILSILTFMVMYRMKRSVYQVAIAVYFIIFVCSYIQGNYLVEGLPPMDGSNIDWNQYPVARMISIVLWVVVCVAATLTIKRIHFEKFARVVRVVGICMFLILVVTLTTVCITTNGYKRKGTLVSTTKNQFEMSTDTNFVILVLDALDAWTFSGMLEENPAYVEIFEDFTYYDNAVSGYPYTKYSMPLILSGKWYENQEPFEDFLSMSIKESPFLSRLEKESYTMGIYDSDLNLNVDKNVGRFENMIEDTGKVSSYSQFVKVGIKMGGIKYAPFDLKRFCYNVSNMAADLREIPNENAYAIFGWSNLPFYEDMLEESVTYTANKCFRFIHTEGAHVPYQYDEYLNVIENGTYRDNVAASITVARTYLDKLKESNVYDNSVIIVMGDHGYDHERGLQGRQNPVLLVKGIGEKHDMNVSNAPVSYDDLQEAYARLLDGKIGNAIFDYKEGDDRERRYLLYKYEEEEHLIEYKQTGPAKELETLVPTGNEYFLEK